MDLTNLSELWTSFVAGPEVLFGLRLATAMPVTLFALATWAEVFRPLSRHPLSPRYDKLMWRVLIFLSAVCISGLASYYLLAGYLEQGRSAGTPFRLLYANAFAGPLFWVLFLRTIKRRKDSWATQAQSGTL